MLEKVESCFESREGTGGCGLPQFSVEYASSSEVPAISLCPANVKKAVTVPQLYAFVFFLLPENKALVIGAVILVFSFFTEGHSLAAL